MSVIIHLMVGQLQLVETNNLLHPVCASGRRIWVNMDPGRRGRVCLPGHDPVGGVEGITVALVVHGGEVHHQHVVLQGVHPVQADLVGREHPPAAEDKKRSQTFFFSQQESTICLYTCQPW